jgi:hypothetical protein
MPDTFTANLNLTKPEVGLSTDTWGTKLNAGLDSLDAIFAPAGTGTSVGLNVGAGRTLSVLTSALRIKDATDPTKQVAFAAAGLTTGTTRTYTWPNADGTLLLNSRQVAAGSGLTGGGDLSADRTLSIAANGVTYAMMQDVTAQFRLHGRNSAGAGDVEELTASQVLDWLDSTRGTILYRGASGWVGLDPSTAGFVLRDNGVGADPSWVGGMTLITSGSASGAGVVDLTLPTGYSSFKLFVERFAPSIGDNSLAWRCSFDNGASYISTASYGDAYALGASNGTNASAGASANTYGSITAGVNSTGTSVSNAVADIFPGSAVSYPATNSIMQSQGVSGIIYGGVRTAVYGGSRQRMTNIRLFSSAGNITLEYKLYGVV